MKSRKTKVRIQSFTLQQSFDRDFPRLLCEYMASHGFALKLIAEKTGLTISEVGNIIYPKRLLVSKYRNGENSIARRVIENGQSTIKQRLPIRKTKQLVA